MRALPGEEHWPLKDMILLHYFGVQQAFQHPSKPTGNGCHEST